MMQTLVWSSLAAALPAHATTTTRARPAEAAACAVVAPGESAATWRSPTVEAYASAKRVVINARLLRPRECVTLGRISHGAPLLGQDADHGTEESILVFVRRSADVSTCARSQRLLQREGVVWLRPSTQQVVLRFVDAADRSYKVERVPICAQREAPRPAQVRPPRAPPPEHCLDHRDGRPACDRQRRRQRLRQPRATPLPPPCCASIG